MADDRDRRGKPDARVSTVARSAGPSGLDGIAPDRETAAREC